MDLWGVKRRGKEWNQAVKTRIIPEWILRDIIENSSNGTYKIKELIEPMTTADGKPTPFDYRKWKWLAFCPYPICNQCCHIMKKGPAHKYERQTGRKAFTAMMASESRLRTQLWLKQGCNAFNAHKPTSNPMAFWTEQDVLLYIYQTKLPICSVYGEVVKDQGEIDGQMDLEDYFGKELFDLERPTLKTTGYNRTGCMFCGFGAHLEKNEGRFVRMKRTHPKQYDYIMRPWEEGGLNYKEVIDWINEHGNLNIKY